MRSPIQQSNAVDQMPVEFSSRCCVLPSCVFVDPDPHDTTLTIIPLIEALLTLSQTRTELLTIYCGNTWNRVYLCLLLFTFVFFLSHEFLTQLKSVVNISFYIVQLVCLIKNERMRVNTCVNKSLY